MSLRLGILAPLALFLGLAWPVAAASSPPPAAAALGSGAALTSPRRPPPSHLSGRKWRIGYVGSGEYQEYSRTLYAIARGLQQLGWLRIDNMPEIADMKKAWLYLATHARSDYIEFVPDAWWQPGNFDTALRPALREAVAARLRDAKDIDLIIAMGTWAGQDMVELGTPVPTVVVSSTDPISARIVPNAADSGQDNLHARVQPAHYQRQIQLFHDIVPFKTLGLVYEDTGAGRTYAAIDKVAALMPTLGFSVKRCDARATGVSIAVAIQNVLHCYQELSSKVDAFYVTEHRGITSTSIKQLATLLRDARVPSFSMQGSDEVKAGLLMSLAKADYSSVGMFHAQTIARIFNGEKPRSISQVWNAPAKIAINLETARRIGFDPPVDILLAADEVYQAEQWQVRPTGPGG